MKKIYAISLGIALAASSISATDLSDARIYLNPGHGSWGGNDRPNGTIPYPLDPTTELPDTCGFYESNTNLWKVLKLGTTLENLGVKKENIMYSRVKNGPFPYVKGAADEAKYNRNLSEICEEVEANNFDLFLSVHSNAATEGTTTNYPLFLYRGKDGQGNEYQAGSYDQADICWGYLNSNGIDPMTYYQTSKNLRGDVSFYGSESDRTSATSGKTYSGYLGVLKHGAPGFLSEGYFHTYQPARHRALNADYCGQEGVRYARGIAAYFGSQGEKTGYIMGTVKDLHEKIVNKLFNYNPKTNDQWLPLNGTVVTLYKGSTKVADYTVDNNYNGVFVFEKLEPGTDYTLECTLEGYKPLTDEYKAPITVKANETTYPMVYLESETYTPPTVVYTDYPDPEQPAYIGVASEYNMDNTVSNKQVDVLKDKVVRRSILRNGNLYVLAIDADNAPYLYVINPDTQEVVKQISTEGIAGAALSLSDIAFAADDVLIGCSKGENQFAADQVTAGTERGVFNVYKWDDMDAAPTKWFTSQSSANFYNAIVGNTLAVSGASEDCKVVTTAVTTGSSTSMRFLEFSVVDNSVASTLYMNKTVSAASNYTETKIGADTKLSVSPRGADQYIIDGSLTTPLEFRAMGQAVDAELLGTVSNSLVKEAATGATYFKYAKHSLMATPAVDDDGKSIGVSLLDITDGLDYARLIATTNTTTDAVDAASTMAAGKVTNEVIDLYLAQNEVINKYSTDGVEQPKVKGIFAYGLKMNKTDNGSYEFKFTANDTPLGGDLLFSDVDSEEVVGYIDLSDLKAGDNTITVTDEELPGVKDQKMTWAVRLKGKSIPTIAQLTDNSADFTYTTAFSTVDNSPESDYFGNIYVNSRVATSSPQNGLYVYNPNWERQNSVNYGGNATNGTLYRLGVDSEGTIYIPNWADAYSGVYIANPADLNADFTQFFVGTRDKDGLFTNNGAEVGGSTPGLALSGWGAYTKLYVYSEDHIINGKGNNIAVYNIGSENGILRTWDKAPSQMFDVGSIEINGNGNIIPTEDGLWVAQTRSSGQNTKSVPSLIFINNEGEVTFNSGDAEWNENLNGTSGSAMALSADGETLVINDAASTFQFFNVAMNDGVPTLTHKYSYKHSIGNSNNVYQMNFDAAGNLVASGKYLAIFSIPTDENESTIPAKEALVVTKTTTSVDSNIADEVTVKVYPNPTTGIINISSNEDIYSVKVYSTTGSQVIDSNESTLDLSSLANGVYIVKINDTKTVSIIKK